MTKPTKSGTKKESRESKRLELKREALKDLDAKEDRNPRGGGWVKGRTTWKNLTGMSLSANG
jgi:hypothetical protein